MSLDPSTRTGAPGRSVLLLFVGVIALQACLVFRRGVFHKEYYTTDNDWGSIAQPTAISQPLLYAKEAKNIFSDRDPKAFIDRQTARSLAEIEVWINGIGATSGIEVVTRPEIPIVSLGKLDVFDYMESPASRERLRATLESYRGKRMFTLVQAPEVAEAIPTIQRSGLRVNKISPIEIPFYSQFKKLKFLLMQVDFQ